MMRSLESIDKEDSPKLNLGGTPTFEILVRRRD